MKNISTLEVKVGLICSFNGYIINSCLFILMKLLTLKKLKVRTWRLIYTFDDKVIFITIYNLNNKNISKQLSCNHHYQKIWVLQLLFATKIQLHVTHATANLCSCIRQVTHDIQLHATLCMQHVYTMLIYMFIHTYIQIQM